MTPKDFVAKYLPFAKKTEKTTGISAIFILAQAAVESGWGERVFGNMFFGIKDTDGINGNEQLLLTTEYHDNPNVKYPKVEKITQTGKRLWKYKVWDWFRKYSSPEESFTDHANFFLKNPRYAKALEQRHLPESFAMLIAKAGYATSPEYNKLLVKVIHMIKREVK